MTKRRIEQYINLKREIAMIDVQVLHAENAGEIVTDTVKGSSMDIRYVLSNITIKGYGSDAIPRLSARRAQMVLACKEIEHFVESMSDSTIRQLLTWRYIEGNSLAETARLVGYSEIHAKRLIKNFFKKMIPNDTK